MTPKEKRKAKCMARIALIGGTIGFAGFIGYLRAYKDTYTACNPGGINLYVFGIVLAIMQGIQMLYNLCEIWCINSTHSRRLKKTKNLAGFAFYVFQFTPYIGILIWANVMLYGVGEDCNNSKLTATKHKP